MNYSTPFITFYFRVYFLRSICIKNSHYITHHLFVLPIVTPDPWLPDNLFAGFGEARNMSTQLEGQLELIDSKQISSIAIS